MEEEKRLFGLSKESMAALGYTSSNIAQKITSLILIPIYVRLMTMDDYGIYSYYQSLIPFLMIFCTLNITGSIIYKGFVKYKENQSEYVSNILGILTFLSTFIFFLFALGYLLECGRMSSLLGIGPVLGCACIVDVWSLYVCTVWRCKNRFDFKYKPVIILNYSISFVSLVFGVMTVYISNGNLIAVIFCKIVIQIIAACYCIADIFRECHLLHNREIWRYVVANALPLLLNLIAIRIVQRADYRIILEKCSSSELALYSFAYSITNLLNVFLEAFEVTLSPMIVQALSSHDDRRFKKEFAVLSSLLCGIGASICLICPEIVQILGTSKYYDSIFCISPLVVGLILGFLSNVILSSLVYWGCTKLITFASVIIASLNIILNNIFVGKYGFVSAAYTTLVSYLVYFCILSFGYRIIAKRKGMDSYDFKLTLIWILSVAMMAVFSVVFVDSFMIRGLLLAGTAFLILYKGYLMYRSGKEI